MKQVKTVRVLVLAAIVAALGAQASFANCLEFGGFAVFQCADLAYFATIPNFDPNVYYFTDPNGDVHIQNVSATFWQLGFGNRTINSGVGTNGTGMAGATTFNGNDVGVAIADIRDGQMATSHPNVPVGSLCLSSNNWGNAGIDGCCDDFRTTALAGGDDGILNPYYDVYQLGQSNAYKGYYSLDWQQDYPMAALLKNVDGKFFAFAAVAALNRGNTGIGENGPCATQGPPGNNPAPCDFRTGSFNFKDVKNGSPNATDPNKLNVIPWQATPDPNIVSNVGVDPNDPNSDRVLDLAWSAVTVHSDLSVRPTNNPSLGGGDCQSPGCSSPTHDATRAAGVGVNDVSSKFGGLVRFVLQVAAPANPNFTAPMSQLETTSTSISGLNIPFGACIRLKTLFGKKPETTTTTAANCRLGKCGDVGYEVVSISKCVGASVCVATGPEVCDNIDNDCNNQIDEGNPGGGASCDTGQLGVCAAGTTTCQSGSLDCIPNTASSAEVCDNIDNDCNGQVDDGNPGGGGACSTGLLGPCGSGTEQCLSGSIQCAQVDPNFPRAETCNNVDDDCNGSVDGFQTSCGTGVCAMNGTCTAGVDDCVPGTPGIEICNSFDDNCDGFTDNIAALFCPTGLPGPCGVGVTACQGGAPTCVQADPNFPKTEVCNGVDDDCNATPDDGPATTPTCGLGTCLRAGTCNSGSIICTPGTPTAEVCNNLDDNCDGSIDGFITTCGVGACQSNGFCSNGVNVCNPGPPASETCNNIDDNCDGSVDGFATACGVGTCASTGNCAAGVDSCVQNPPGVEICDNLDNDCNGAIDNVTPACTLYVTTPLAGDVLDCTSPTTFQPTIVWNKGPYDKFKVSIGTNASFSKGTFVTSGDKQLTTNTWHVKSKAWKKICGKVVDGGPLFVRIAGVDINVPTSNPLRKFNSPTVQAVANK